MRPNLFFAVPRVWTFSNDRRMYDQILYWAPGWCHVQLEQWNFEHGEDQFRPEVGLHLRDARRSTYTLQWRHERDDERAWAGSEQVIGKRWVGRGEVSPLFFRDSTTVVWDVGADVYYGSYGFAGVTLLHDPREGGLWVVPVRARLATERNDWLQLSRRRAAARSAGRWTASGAGCAPGSSATAGSTSRRWTTPSTPPASRSRSRRCPERSRRGAVLSSAA